MPISLRGDKRQGRAVRLTLPLHPPTATAVIQIFCPGGLSHVDTWDYGLNSNDCMVKPSMQSWVNKRSRVLAGAYAKSFGDFVNMANAVDG